jgi:hypothetical protein
MKRPIRGPSWCIVRKEVTGGVSLDMLAVVSRELPAMAEVKSVAQWMVERGVEMAGLVAASKIEQRVVEAIVQGRYTPSPDQRERLARALGLAAEEIAWGHVTPVEHMYGHGAQFGRSP